MNTTNTLWAVQATLYSGKKFLCFGGKGKDRGLYFALDEKISPKLFITKKQAIEAMKKVPQKPNAKLMKKMFSEVIDCKSSQPVKVKVSQVN